MKLTEHDIERAELPASGKKERLHRFDELRGLGLRTLPSGEKSFFFEARIKRRPRRITLGRWPDLSIQLARQRALKMRADIAGGDDPHKTHFETKREATFGDLTNRYLKNHAIKHKVEKAWREDQRLFAQYIPRGWNARQLSDVSCADVEDLHSEIGNEHGQYAANHLLRLLRHAFNLAIEWKMLRGENPATRIKFFHEQPRERFLNANELQRLNQALLQEPDWRWRAYFPLALLLGTRRTELAAMCWDDINLAERTWRIRKTKNGQPHLLPLPAPAIAILTDLPSRECSEWVFPSESAAGHIMDPSSAWRRIRKRAGVADVRIHDLRHTKASWMLAEGYSLSVIARALNHRRIETTQRYAHLDLTALRAAMEQTAQRMTNALLVPPLTSDPA